ncbi:MAG: hypothetical protein Kow0059_18510 [Candidatus Sumerlaeia bacterium]
MKTRQTPTLRSLIVLPVFLTIGLVAAMAQPRYELLAKFGSGEIFENPKVKEKLQLTDEQVSKLKEGVESVARKQVELDAQLKLAHMDLNKLLDADKVDEKAVTEAVKKIGDIQTQQLLNRTMVRVLIKNTLNPEQEQKMKEAIGERLKQRRQNAAAGEGPLAKAWKARRGAEGPGQAVGPQPQQDRIRPGREGRVQQRRARTPMMPPQNPQPPAPPADPNAPDDTL